MKIPGWAIALAVCAFFAALVGWVVHVPDAPVVVPPFDPPKVRLAAARDSGAAPEDEPVGEDLPAMPVGTADLPEQLARRKREAGMDEVKHRVDRCRGLEPFNGILTVRLTISQSGNVKSAVVVPQPAGAFPLADWLNKESKEDRFPRFRGLLIPTIELTYPFLFKGG